MFLCVFWLCSRVFIQERCICLMKTYLLMVELQYYYNINDIRHVLLVVVVDTMNESNWYWYEDISSRVDWDWASWFRQYQECSKMFWREKLCICIIIVRSVLFEVFFITSIDEILTFKITTFSYSVLTNILLLFSFCALDALVEIKHFIDVVIATRGRLHNIGGE